MSGPDRLAFRHRVPATAPPTGPGGEGPAETGCRSSPRVFGGDVVDRRVRLPWTLVLGVALGLLSGVLAGLAIAGGGLVALAVALGGFATLVLVGVVAVRESSRNEMRRARETIRRENRGRFDHHAERINREVLGRLAHAVLRVDPPRTADGPPTGPMVSVAVDPDGSRIQSLPGWDDALVHLRADPEAANAYDTMVRAVGAYRAAREAAARVVVDHLASHVLSEYGFTTRLRGSRLDPPPWCDLPSLTGLLLSTEPGGDAPSLTRIALPGDGAPAAASGFYLLSGEAPILAVREAAESDPHRLQRVLEATLEAGVVVRRTTESAARERAAREAVDRFAEIARRYSDRVTVGAPFGGRCRVCAGWVPR